MQIDVKFTRIAGIISIRYQANRITKAENDATNVKYGQTPSQAAECKRDRYENGSPLWCAWNAAYIKLKQREGKLAV